MTPDRPDADRPLDAAAGHPRPTLVRDRWRELAGSWDFCWDDADVGVDEGWYDGRNGPFDRQITVPFPPESPASGIGDRTAHRVLWYRTSFSSDAGLGERLLLHFAAVDYRAQVWVDGTFVTEHVGGHTPFSADVTAALVDGDEHVLVVRAEDDAGDLEQPRGKQDWEAEPHIIWYARTSGIWQPVWLEPVPALRIEDLRWTPDVDVAELRVDVRLNRVADSPAWIRVRLRQGDELVADASAAVRRDRASVVLRVGRGVVDGGATTVLDRERVQWSPEYPTLFDADLTLTAGDPAGDVLDRVGSYAALRSIDASGSTVRLNGWPYFLRLVLDQGFRPSTHLAYEDADAARREVEQVKRLGFNGVRMHQRLPDPRFLYWADRLGLLVWAEMPSAYDFTPRMVDRVVREWTEAVDRYYNHPCVIAWVPVNESWGVPTLPRSLPQREFVRALYHLTRSLDPTRLVIGNDGWEHVVTDVVTVHDYTSRGAVLTERYGTRDAVRRTLAEEQPGYRAVLLPDLVEQGRPVMVTEFGGITYNADDGETWSGYSAVTTADEFLARYADLVTALLDAPGVAGFCYTQLADTMQERNGLLTAEGRPKVDEAALRRVTRRPAAAVPADAIGAGDEGSG